MKNFIELNNDYIVKKFNLFNKKYFNSELKIVAIKLNRSNKIIGYTKWKEENNIYTAISLEFTKNIFWSESFFNNILLHEMIHLWQIQKQNDHGHSSLFKKKMQELNKKGFDITEKIKPFNVQYKKKKRLFVLILKDKDNNYSIITLKDKPSQIDNVKISNIIKDKELIYEGYKESEILNNFTAHRNVKGSYKINKKYANIVFNLIYNH
jgi:hypothetical protein